MDVQDHKKNPSSEQEIHNVHLCHKCGWAFPNSHPSAKHRRAHKRVCGTVEGYKKVNSGSDHSNLAGSDNEHVTDDDRQNLSPNSGKMSVKESVNSGGVGLKSNKSEDELFSDAITEFSNNPSLDKNVSGEGSHAMVDSHLSKDEKTAGMSQPQHDETELQKGSINAGEMSDGAVMRGEINQFETTKSFSDTGNVKVLDAVSSSRTCLKSNSSLAISEIIVVSDAFHDTSELIVISDNSKTDCETGKGSSSLGQYIRDDEKGDEASEELHCSTSGGVLQSERKIGIEQKLGDMEGIISGPLEREATTTEIENETLDPNVQHDSQFKLNDVNVETSHERIVSETANEEVLANDLQFKDCASSQTKQHELSVSEVESDSPKHLIHSSPSHSNEVCDDMEAGSESSPFLSPAETFPAEENMSGDFKDYEIAISGISLDLLTAEEDRSPENDKNPIPENFQDAPFNLPDGTVDCSYLNPLESKVEKHVSTPETGPLCFSVTQNLPSANANAFLGTIDDLKENSVSTTVDGEVDTVVPDLPSAPQSTLHLENVVFSSEHSNIQNVISAGSVDISFSDAFKGEQDKAAISTPIDGETAMAVPGNLSSVPCGTENSSSVDWLQDDLKKLGTMALIDVDSDCTSVTANIPHATSSVSARTLDGVLLDDLKYDLKKEDVSTSISVGCIPPVPVLTIEESNTPAGTLENIIVEGMDDDLIKNSVSTPINGDFDSSLCGNLPSANSNAIVESVNNSASEPVDDDLRKEVVSTLDGGGEGVAAIHEDHKSLSSAPVVESSDNILPETLQDNREEDVSTLHYRNIDTSVPDNLPCVLSSVPSGTEDNSCEEASEEKEVVLTPGSMEIGSSGFRVTSEEDNHLLLSAAALPSVKNPEAMMGDFEDHKVLKSKFGLNVRADEEIKLMEDDEMVNVTHSPVAFKDVHAENIDYSLSDNFEEGLKKEGVSIPIHGEAAGAFGFKGTSDEESHLLSVADSSSAVDNSEAPIGEFKDYKVFKSSFSLDCGDAEEIISPENDEKATAAENLSSSVSCVRSGNTDNSPSDALEDDLGKEGVSIPIDGEIDTSEFMFNSDVDLGDYVKSPSWETDNSELNQNAKGSPDQSIDGKSMQNEDSEHTSRQESDVVPLETSTVEQTCGSGNDDNHEDDKLFHVAAGNDNIQAGDEPSNSGSAALARVETIAETTEKPVLLVGNQSIDLENSSAGFPCASDIQTVEVTCEKKLANQPHPTGESTHQLLRSDCLDEARNPHHINAEVIASEKFCDSSESLGDTAEDLRNSEGLKMGDKIEVSTSSIASGIVSELKYEDPIQKSEHIQESSRLKEVAAPAVESQNIIDTPVLGPLHNDVDETMANQNLSFLTGDNITASSSRTDSLEGHWGSVSVISAQSDVGNFANATDIDNIQVAEKLDNEFKKQEKQAAMDKSDDVFEPPSFMTLVESGVAVVDRNATGSEMQKTETNEQSKSEALKAGWFPSITNVLNDSEGRKKNEEIISKVTNWSTGKQHSPLKNLLNEAQAETKLKALSPPNVKQVPAANNNNQADDETASASKNNVIPVTTSSTTTTTTTATTVSSILGSEMQETDTVKKEMEKEWNSPARYPIQVKKEKRKGKPYWVPFVCCTSVHQDV